MADNDDANGSPQHHDSQDAFVDEPMLYDDDHHDDMMYNNAHGGAGHDSGQSFGNNSIEDTDDPSYLYSVLEDALPRQLDVQGRPLTAAQEQQLKRDKAEQTWERIRRWLREHPRNDDRRAAAYIRGQADATSLHMLCKIFNPPEDVVLAIVNAAPDVASWTDTQGWLPLHHACAYGASPEVLKLLIEAYPEGKTQQDKQLRTPLHFYVTRTSDSVASMTVNAEMLSDTGAAALRENGGMMPMHYACAYGTHPAVLNVIAEVCPESLVAKENHGRTPMHLAMVNAHRDASPGTIQFLLEHESSKATINTRDQDGFLPLHLLALGLKGYRTEDPEKRSNVSHSLSMYLAAEPVPTADFLTAIQDLPDWLGETAVVSKHVRNVLNNKIVKRFPTSILMLDGYLFLVLIVCFGITTKNHIDMRFTKDSAKPIENSSQAALAILFVGAAYFFFRELVQVISIISLGSFSNWYKDMTNWLDIAVIILVLYYAILMVTPNQVSLISDEGFRSGAAFTQGLLWVAIIMFLKKTLVDFAVFVGGVFYVVQRLAAFLLAVGVILLGFAQMFYFVYVHTPYCPTNSTNTTDLTPLPDEVGEIKCYFPHCSFWDSLLKVYTMMMGEIGDQTRYTTNRTAEVLYLFYGFLVVILLSNVLIAIVTDSYEVIQNDRAAIVFWNNRLDFIAEMDAISYAVQRRVWRICCCGMGLDNETNKSQRGMNGNDDIDDNSDLDGAAKEGPTDSNTFPTDMTGGVDLSTDFFREAWHQVMLLFDANLYDEIDLFEALIYNVFRFLCLFIIIPLWLCAGIITAGWLWPPQVREYLFVQSETTTSRAELEKKKIEQLQVIQDDLKTLKQDIKHEMSSDRDEVLRMRNEIETVQSELLADLQQVKELMGSLLGE